MHGGERIAEVLHAAGARFLFTLCGGHISPILVGCRRRGIRVVDTRHEATAVFAADAVARLGGGPGVAAVTAGPGATNTLTAVKNAQLAQSPVVLLVGATATALRGRGALQDIDQRALLRPHVKGMTSVRRVRELAPAVAAAIERAHGGVPGPVAVECPVDLLYDERRVREWYGVKSAGGGGLRGRLLSRYLSYHVERLFRGAGDGASRAPRPVQVPKPDESAVHRAARRVGRAERPLLLIGSQALLDVPRASELAAAVERLGMPVYLSGMARGLLGPGHPLQLRHRRRQALREADLVLLAGVPCDFRLDYGRHIRRSTTLVAANRSARDRRLNRRPDLAIGGDPGRFLVRLAATLPADGGRRDPWLGELRARDGEREAEICAMSRQATEFLNPLQLCAEIESTMAPDAVIVADGGDFVATASYVLRPRGPLSWLDPGVFGTLGVGAGFALGAKLVRPESDVWILLGDGAAGYGLAEFDTFVRHRLPVIAVVGNDGCWMQIARDQIVMLEDDVGCMLERSDYHRSVEGLGATGLRVADPGELPAALHQAVEAARAGRPVLVNALIGRTDFRKGSISI